MALLEDKRILITGVLTDASLAYGVAQLRWMRAPTSCSRALAAGCVSPSAPLASCRLRSRCSSSTSPTRPRRPVRDALESSSGRLMGLHAIGFMPEVGLGEDFMAAEWDEISVGFNISAYSLKTVAEVVRPLMPTGGRSWASTSTPGLPGRPTTGWASRRPHSRSPRDTLARALGPDQIRVNLVAAGPIRTMAAKSIPGFKEFEDAWDARSPSGGTSTTRPRGQGLCRDDVGLVPTDHRRDDPRRWRLPRRRRLTPLKCSGPEWPAP